LAGSGVIWKGLLKVVRKTELECLNAEYDIVIDGSNLINHSEKGVTKLIPSRLIKAIRKVELLGYTPLTCIDRSTYNQAKKQKKPLEGSIEDFVKLIDEEGMRFMNRDDEMINHALQRGALILTNDRFRKWKDGTEKTKLEIDWDMVDENLVQWWFEDDFFMPELLKKSSQSSKRIGKAPINSVRRLANNNSNKDVQKKKRSMFIKVLDLIFDNNKKVREPQKKAKKQHNNQIKSKPQAPKKPQAKPQQKKANPQQNKAKKNPQTKKPKPQQNKPNPPSKKSVQAKPPQKKPQPSSKKSTKSKQVKNTSSDIANFKSKILEILPDRKISISGLATIITKQMVAAGIEKNPTTEFLKQYKLPKGLKKAIGTHMSDEVIITGTGTKFFIEKKSKAD
jgi:hypothetical protein